MNGVASPGGPLHGPGSADSILQDHNRRHPSNRGPVVHFVKPAYDRETHSRCGSEEPSKQPEFHDLVVGEVCKVINKSHLDREPASTCYLDRLPVNVRLRIFGFLFPHDRSVLEVENFPPTEATNLAILRTSHQIYHEASIALFHSLAYRRVFLKNYGASTAYLLRRFPRELESCHWKWLGSVCYNNKLDIRRAFGSIVLSLGDRSHELAVHRRWNFSIFITTLRMDVPLRVHDLTIIATDNWKMPGFDETHLTQDLFSGAFEILGRMMFKGFTRMERKRLVTLILAKRDPRAQVMRRSDEVEVQVK
ncbi:hypothetical protein BO94DRAFT_558353 [Aspergillus sclerotioniger CBS 115572]|uniref:F-box domain-containing protein n=1 Tax=Aspergillus sclerotioniger CBS 115572 TaxID=1450535 RepID=A0A317W4J6_9EURO|nr:hypothetical protein BO94DRAFT_558353 [Aspergillus sclerotioniger CBS 115572]PWY80965.1 hypothetical protein BO94DRAFT_558353 [Aspergillus sclerotioniger CBS 115572]